MDYRNEAKKLHKSVNQKYGGYNYVLHLDAVQAVHTQFSDENDYPKMKSPLISDYDADFEKFGITTQAIYFHDSIEDCRVTPNDLLYHYRLPQEVVKIVFAVTNEKGWSRKERANEAYYKQIRETPGASFVKMCDRIANVRFSLLTNSTMLDRYRKENEEFMKAIDADRFPRMKKHLINLFDE